MFRIEIKGLKELQASVDNLVKNKIPIITAIALTRTAQGFARTMEQKISEEFNNPIEQTIKSVYFSVATTGQLTSRAYIRDTGGKRKGPQVKYLLSEEYGGPRRLKRFEVALQNAGILPRGMYAVPGKAAKMDANGNMSPGQLVQILAYFQAYYVGQRPTFTTDKRKKKLAKGSKRTGERGWHYFVGRPGHDGALRRGVDLKAASGLPLGIWRTTTFGPWGTAVQPILIFVRSTNYKMRLQFHKNGQEYVDREFPRIFKELVEERLIHLDEKAKSRG